MQTRRSNLFVSVSLINLGAYRPSAPYLGGYLPYDTVTAPFLLLQHDVYQPLSRAEITL
jgi:hypothetical protein